MSRIQENPEVCSGQIAVCKRNGRMEGGECGNFERRDLEIFKNDQSHRTNDGAKLHGS